MKKILIVLIILFGIYIFIDLQDEESKPSLINEKIEDIYNEENLGYDLCYRKKSGTYTIDYYLISFKRMNVTSIGVVGSKKDLNDVKGLVILTCSPISGSLEDGWIIEEKSSYKYILDSDNKKVYGYKNDKISEEYNVCEVTRGIKYLKIALKKNYGPDTVYQTLTGHYFEEEE